MRKNSRLTFVCSLLVCSAVVAACGSSSGGSTNSADKSGVVEITTVRALTGPGAAFGVVNLAGQKLAVEEINAKGGVDGHKLKLNIIDEQSSTTRTAQIYKQLASSDDLVVSGPDLSSDSRVAFPIVKAAGLPDIALLSDARVLDLGRPWTFSSYIPAQVALPVATPEWVKTVKASRVVAFIDGHDDASKIQGDVMAENAKKSGADVVKTINFQTAQPNYSAEISLAKSQNPDGILVAGLSNDAGNIVKGLRASGVDAPIMLSMTALTPSFLDIVGAVSDLYATVPYWNTADVPNNQQFVDGIKRYTNGVPPGSGTPSTYAEIYVIAQALHDSGVLDSNDSVKVKRQKVREAMAKATDIPALTGHVAMNEQGFLALPALFLKVDNGQVHILKELPV